MAGWNIVPLCSFGMGSKTFREWFSKLSRKVFTQLWIPDKRPLFVPKKIWPIKSRGLISCLAREIWDVTFSLIVILKLCISAEGTWSEWESWGACSSTCGQGTRTRVKSHYGGRRPCQGQPKETENCQGEMKKIKSDCYWNGIRWLWHMQSYSLGRQLFPKVL